MSNSGPEIILYGNCMKRLVLLLVFLLENAQDCSVIFLFQIAPKTSDKNLNIKRFCVDLGHLNVTCKNKHLQFFWHKKEKERITLLITI